MCKCNPNIRTPFCGKGDCQPPGALGTNKVSKAAEDLKSKLRTAVAGYMASEGCACCSNEIAHSEHKRALGRLLDVPGTPDGDDLYYDFRPYRSGE